MRNFLKKIDVTFINGVTTFLLYNICFKQNKKICLLLLFLDILLIYYEYKILGFSY